MGPRIFEVEADEESRQAGAVRAGLEDAAEARRSNIEAIPTNAKPTSTALPARIDRVRLDARCARVARRLHDVLEQRSGDAAPTVADADPEAADRPHRPIVDGRDRSRADESRRFGPHDDPAPADRLVAEIGEEPRRDRGSSCARSAAGRLPGPPRRIHRPGHAYGWHQQPRSSSPPRITRCRPTDRRRRGRSRGRGASDGPSGAARALRAHMVERRPASRGDPTARSRA